MRGSRGGLGRGGRGVRNPLKFAKKKLKYMNNDL